MKLRTLPLAAVVIGVLAAGATQLNFSSGTGSGSGDDTVSVTLRVIWDDHEAPDGDPGNGAARVEFSGTLGAAGGNAVPPNRTRRSPWSITTTAKRGARIGLNAHSVARQRFPHCIIFTPGRKADSATGGSESPGTCSVSTTA